MDIRFCKCVYLHIRKWFLIRPKKMIFGMLRLRDLIPLKVLRINILQINISLEQIFNCYATYVRLDAWMHADCLEL